MRSLAMLRTSVGTLIPAFYFGTLAFLYLAMADTLIGALALMYGIAVALMVGGHKYGKFAVTGAAVATCGLVVLSGTTSLYAFVLGTNALAVAGAWQKRELERSGLERIRLGAAGALLAFYFGAYGLLFVLGLADRFDKDLARYAGAIAACYGLAIAPLAIGAFWARWFAFGTALYGVSMGALGLIVQWEMKEIHFFILFTHGVPALCLFGNRMERLFEGQSGWRERFRIDAGARAQLGKAITRAGIFLPITLGYALAPRQGQFESVTIAVLAGIAALGVIRGRSYGLVAAAAAMAVTAVDLAFGAAALAPIDQAQGALAIATLTWAVVPFAVPMWNHLRRRDV